MFIKFEINKKREYWWLSIFSSMLFALVGIVMGVALWCAAAIAFGLLFVLNVRIHFEENTPLFVGPLIALLFSIAIFCEIQLAVGTTLKQITFLLATLNVLIVYALILFGASACGNLSGAMTGVQLALITLGVANNLVVQTRGMEIQFSDILSISTAATVAGDYTYSLTTRSVIAIMLTVVQVFFFTFNRLPPFKKMRLRVASLSTSTVSLVLIIALVSTSGGAAAIGFQLKSWKLQPSSYNGFLINLLHSVSATRVNEPDGYSQDALDQLLNQYYPSGTPSTPGNESEPTNESGLLQLYKYLQYNRLFDEVDNKLLDWYLVSGDSADADKPLTNPETTEEPEAKKPNVIVIMNETFSDLAGVASAIGKEFVTDVEVLPFFNSLSDGASNISKGYALASVFGGNTANSEFEFLTSNTMAFLPQNTVAYNLYLNENNAFSVVQTMKAAGYRTIGMHPEVGTNWSRNRIYGYYGFDESYFLETDVNGAKSFVSDKALTDEELYRGHVSDSTIYNRIIELYENKEEGESIFTFAITMQNHGGYTSKDFQYDVHLNSAGTSKSVDEYLSSIHNSDAALQELIAYFEAQEEETLIVMFGDHQPSLPNAFYAECFGLTDSSTTEQLQAKYVVPYLYWGNFDFETNFGAATSINYLSNEMLNIIGVEKPRFMELLELIETEIPVINSFGWWDNDMEFYSISGVSTNAVKSVELTLNKEDELN